jgi:hypothetical protein
VVECDQAESIAIKQELANRKWQTDYITYVSLDLNDNVWSNLKSHLDKINSAVLVILEGVSSYIDQTSFDQFLNFLAVRLNPGSVIVYDYKIRSAADDFVPSGSTKKRGFRLPATKDRVIAYHEALGFKVEHLELSSELSLRLLPNLAIHQTPLFVEDGLVKLVVPVAPKGDVAPHRAIIMTMAGPASAVPGFAG